MIKTVAFIDSVHPILEDQLTNIGVECINAQHLSQNQIEEKIHLWDGIVIRSRIKINHDLLTKAIKLKFIARSGAGLENIDLESAKKRNIHVFNSPEGNMDAVGEQAIGMLLMLFNHLKRIDTEVRNGIWLRAENRGLEISGKTIAIIGYGNMGSAFAKKLSGFGAHVIAYDKYKTGFSSEYVTEVSLNEIFDLADVVSLHTPLTSETIGLIDSSFLSKFKKQIFIINTARGQSLITKDLMDAIDNNMVRGACLDVFDFEKFNFESIHEADFPIDFKRLINSDKVILSPHVAGWTEESYIKLSSFLADKIIHTFNL